MFSALMMLAVLPPTGPMRQYWSQYSTAEVGSDRDNDFWNALTRREAREAGAYRYIKAQPGLAGTLGRPSRGGHGGARAVLLECWQRGLDLKRHGADAMISTAGTRGHRGHLRRRLLRGRI